MFLFYFRKCRNDSSWLCIRNDFTKLQLMTLSCFILDIPVAASHHAMTDSGDKLQDVHQLYTCCYIR